MADLDKDQLSTTLRSAIVHIPGLSEADHSILLQFVADKLGESAAVAPVDTVTPTAPLGELSPGEAQLVRDHRSGGGSPSSADAGNAAPSQAPADVSSQAAPQSQPQTAGDNSPQATNSADSGVKATPAAEAHAAEVGVNLNSVEGSGKDGTVIKSDVAQAANGS